MGVQNNKLIISDRSKQAQHNESDHFSDLSIKPTLDFMNKQRNMSTFYQSKPPISGGISYGLKQETHGL